MDNATSSALIVIGVLILLVFALWIYFIPTFVAFKRNHPNRLLILVLNLLVGSTLIGWIIALIWATRSAHLSPSGEDRKNGGESGLNIFANDQPQAHTENSKVSIPVSDLERLALLRSQGMLTDEEFKEQKQRLLCPTRLR
jgi:type VI protein secretion system component VasK